MDGPIAQNMDHGEAAMRLNTARAITTKNPTNTAIVDNPTTQKNGFSFGDPAVKEPTHVNSKPTML